MTGMLRWPRLIIAWSVEKIFLWARSPVAPKKTSASEFVFVMRAPWNGRFLGSDQQRALVTACLARRIGGDARSRLRSSTRLMQVRYFVFDATQ